MVTFRDGVGKEFDCEAWLRMAGKTFFVLGIGGCEVALRI